ncbi:hypothetical protein JQX09_24320 [Sulfitobacter pseudonitzschiae]|uniref:Helix-turn-helix domain-containing protein n=1 Tax=Pseudosulfitobacter pseudonitzschiae TaxID=1402135 RepID=A0A9Q2RV56_9RHOB|nr:hypothetical protein [Pseudosulfitobacter pseudonitzschiae]MBM1816233.1 hypothetical protein [Pseudosulfitobacter pseudonitzschiae]MBM1833724.1 hypothetical protein [Pseudosulfitobacter pseudonitzschiae]MBM1838590.1 hypothetical protein [Pseudosulfitobacter pseudonitzschiae]MBM1842938.1 hypothetical protein [Pseudosulfitobacter pseudonitzschiae]MBM1847804.1 hypothetical protein [Pseudosulfitobacter pseudonitzschiae]
MHAAKLSSDRLSRVNRLLSDRKPHSTRSIMRKTHVCAINTCVSELRQLGADIKCERKYVNGRFVFYYTMLTPPDEAPETDQPLNFTDDV